MSSASSDLGPQDLAARRPGFTPEEAQDLARELFGVQGSARELASERDQNFRIRAGDEAFVLKIAQAGEDPEVLDLQHAAMAHVARAAPRVAVPRVVPRSSGEALGRVSQGGREHLVRMLTYLPGTPLALVRPHGAQLLHDLGRSLAELDAALRTFEHPAQDRRIRWDLQHAEAALETHAEAVVQPERRRLVDAALADFRATVLPRAERLRRSVVHHDANDHNVLVEESPGVQRIAGLIDFGDLVRSFTVSDLAVACAYVLLGKRAPLAALAPLLAGFESALSLDDVELEVLPTLIRTRLATSVAISAWQARLEPENEYLSVTEAPAWEALRFLDAQPAGFFEAFARHAVGRPASAQVAPAVKWLRENGTECAPVVDVPFDAETTRVVDLSPGGDLAGPDVTIPELTRRLDRLAASEGARVLVGRYDEPRLLYGSDVFRYATEDGDEQRTVHLGIDLFLPAGTPVFSPLRGEVVALVDQAGELDYGPTVVLRHEPAEGVAFHTLYGHLGPGCLEALAVGRVVEAGERLATIGAPPGNGGWTPHLHFQLFVEDFGLGAGFPGVAAPEERALWTSLSPDPNLVLRLPEALFPAPAPRADALLEARGRHFSPALGLSYARPLTIVRGHLQHLFDDHGRAFLDAVNNVPHVGHCHPRVVAAGARQMAVLNTNTRYLHENLTRYAQRLTATMPAPLEVCFFVCSGSEANELALRLARAHTGGHDVVVLDGAYHGNTQALVDLSPYKFGGPGGRGQVDGVQVAEMPDGYRGRFRGSSEDVGRRFAEDVGARFRTIAEAGRRPAAFLAEPLLGCGGQIVPPAGYLRAAFEHARRAGAVCIADEVQVGFGRVGTHYWAFETQDCVPDIVTLGKPIANGHPMGAVVTTREVAESFATGMEFFNTFGGNPVSCAIALAVLDVLEDEGLLENAREVGAQLLDDLRELAARHALIGDVRGRGLYAGVELVLDRETLEPAPAHAAYVAGRMKDHGVLISTDGPLHNVLKIKPPLCFSRADAARLCAALDAVLAETCLAARR